MRQPLPNKEIPVPDWVTDEESRLHWNRHMRVLFFDPSEVYQRIDHLINPLQRNQGRLSTAVLFPKRKDGICRCGCGQPAKRLWANEECQTFAYKVYDLIAYGTARASFLLNLYYGPKCIACGEKNWTCIDHIIPVKHGGGGCWISNYAPLCKECHTDKTNRDFGYGKYKPVPERPRVNTMTLFDLI